MDDRDLDEPRPEPDRLARAVTRLGDGMIVLALFRLILDPGSGWRGFDALVLAAPTSARDSLPTAFWLGLSWGLWIAWPLLLAVAVRWWRQPGLLPALFITALVIACEGVLGLALGWSVISEARGMGLLAHPSQPWFLASARVAVQTVFALVLVVGCWRLSRGWRRHQREISASGGAKRAILGRLTVLGALVFAFLTLCAQLWPVAIEIIARSETIRDFILDRAPREPVRTYRLVASPESRAASAANRHITSGLQMVFGGQYEQAIASYTKGIEGFEVLLKADPDRVEYQRELALGANNLAWLLATCPELAWRDPPRAVAFARRAVDLFPEDGNAWNTLGVAYYRAGNQDKALAALNRSLEVRQGGDAYDWFFLAMIEQERGRIEQAGHFFEQAIAWVQANRPQDEELHRFWAEAAAKLNRSAPPALESRPNSPLTPPRRRVRSINEMKRAGSRLRPEPSALPR
jgi:hypothetical protein